VGVNFPEWWASSARNPHDAKPLDNNIMLIEPADEDRRL
jgi:hypothetical protein